MSGDVCVVIDEFNVLDSVAGIINPFSINSNLDWSESGMLLWSFTSKCGSLSNDDIFKVPWTTFRIPCIPGWLWRGNPVFAATIKIPTDISQFS